MFIPGMITLILRGPLNPKTLVSWIEKMITCPVSMFTQQTCNALNTHGGILLLLLFQISIMSIMSHIK